MQEYLFPIPFAVFGGIVIWIMIFLGTYPHFPRMEKQKRILFSITSATIAAVMLMAILFILIYLSIGVLIK